MCGIKRAPFEERRSVHSTGGARLVLVYDLLHRFSVFADELRQVVCNGNVESVDRASAEVRARGAEQREIVKWIQSEKVPINVRIGQVIARYVLQCAQALVDVIVLRILDNLVADLLLISKERLVIVVRG